MQHLTEVLTDGPIERGVTVAHLSGKGTWPACMPEPSGMPKTGRWLQKSFGFAESLGAVPCTETACAEAVTR
jgi:hypothetical protein